MMHHFDHRWATYAGGRVREVTLKEKQDPDFVVLPRYWVPAAEVTARASFAPRELGRAWLAGKALEVRRVLTTWWWGAVLLAGGEPPRPLGELQARLEVNDARARSWGLAWPLTPAELAALAAEAHALALAGCWLRRRRPPFLLGWRDIARSTDKRTVIAGVLPWTGVGNNYPLMMLNEKSVTLAAALSANLTAFCYDFVARQNAGGTHLNFFLYKQLPVLPPSTYNRPCPWSGEISLQEWLAPRVLELTYTAHDLAPFARDLGYDGPPLLVG